MVKVTFTGPSKEIKVGDTIYVRGDTFDLDPAAVRSLRSSGVRFTEVTAEKESKTAEKKKEKE